MQIHSAITWFEIPVGDMERANRFYAQVLGKQLERQQFGPNELRVFPYQQPGVGGCLMPSKPLQPGAMGPVIYLAVDGSLQAALQRVTRANGQIVVARTELPENMGCYAHIIDSEGNRVGLHATT